MAITIYKTPVTLYYDSVRALNRDATQSGTWRMTGVHQTVNQVTQDGITVYAINHPQYGYTVGWVRGDDIGQAGVNEQEELRYTVQFGDTLWIIANKFGTTVNNLKTWNGLTGDLILVGQSLIVRKGKTTIIGEDEDGGIVETTPTVMTVEIDGAKYDLVEGINDNSGIKLPVGVTKLKVTGNGTISFHFHKEVMG